MSTPNIDLTNPHELYELIEQYLSNPNEGSNDLIYAYRVARSLALAQRNLDGDLPSLPKYDKDEAVAGLEEIMDWCIDAHKAWLGGIGVLGVSRNRFSTGLPWYESPAEFGKGKAERAAKLLALFKSTVEELKKAWEEKAETKPTEGSGGKTGETKEQQIRKIKEYAEKLLGLLVGEAMPSHKPDASEVGEICDKLRRAYRKKVLALLGDDSDDWVYIVRIFEDNRPQRLPRLEAMRQRILLHTDPDKKQVNSLQPQGNNFGPNDDLRSKIEQLRNELLYEAQQPAELKPIEASIKAVIQQLSDWSKEYLSDGAQLEGKVAPEAPVKLIDIMDERTFGRLDDRLDQNNRQKKAGRIRAEYQKIIKWVQSGGNETFPQNDEESPFTHNGQQYYVKLIELLQEVLQDSELQTFGQKPVESEPTAASGTKAANIKKPQGKGGQAIMSYDDIQKDLALWKNFLRHIKKDVSSGEIRNYGNVLNGLKRLAEPIVSLRNKQKEETILRACNHLDDSRKELQDIVSDSLNEPTSWVKVTNRLDDLIDELDGLSALLAEASQSPSEEEKGGQPTAEAISKEKGGQNKVKEPSKEATQAYTLYYGAGKTQEDVAKIMTDKLKRPVKQGQVSRWVNQYKKWREAEEIPVDDTKPNIIVNSDILDMGARTDGRGTGDPRHKKNTDYNQ